MSHDTTKTKDHILSVVCHEGMKEVPFFVTPDALRKVKGGDIIEIEILKQKICQAEYVLKQKYGANVELAATLDGIEFDIRKYCMRGQR